MEARQPLLEVSAKETNDKKVNATGKSRLASLNLSASDPALMPTPLLIAIDRYQVLDREVTSRRAYYDFG